MHIYLFIFYKGASCMLWNEIFTSIEARIFYTAREQGLKGHAFIKTHLVWECQFFYVKLAWGCIIDCVKACIVVALRTPTTLYITKIDKKCITWVYLEYLVKEVLWCMYCATLFFIVIAFLSPLVILTKSVVPLCKQLYGVYFYMYFSISRPKSVTSLEKTH